MLNVGKLAGVGGADYYLDQVASGVEDYYTGRGEAAGYWTGTAAAVLGLDGTVEAEQLRVVLSGADPRSGTPLGSWKSGRVVPGFDVTFRAPKSVAVLWGLGDEDTAAAVREAHDAAVAAAVGYLEDTTAWSRRGAGGRERVRGRGLVGAAFRHRTSRAGDPLLHTHVLVANVVQAADDGRWRTLDARRLYRHAKTAGYLYQAQLRHELTRRLGVAWRPVGNGYADIDGVPEPVLRAFSTRRREIEARMADRGETSAGAAQVATLDTRRPKRDVDGETLRARWRTQAGDLGFDVADLAQVVGRRGYERVDAHALAALAAAVAAGDGVTEHTATFTSREVIQYVCERIDAAGTVSDVLACADAAVAGGDVVTLRGPGHGLEAWYSTADMLAVEQRLLAMAGRRRRSMTGVATDAAVDRAVAARPTLRGEQAAMVRRLCRQGDGVAVVVGKAGTGKTFALDAAGDAWRQSGFRVTGCALAGRAAQELTDATGVPGFTIAELLGWLDRGDRRAELTRRDVVIVDEAGMVGTRVLARLSDHAARAGAKLVLVGDHRQLPEILAGGAFAALVDRADPIVLRRNRRQAAVWERGVLEQLRSGDPRLAARLYQRYGRVTVADTADATRELLVADWWATRQAQGDRGAGVMVAVRVADVDDLNARARGRMVADGLVGGAELVTGDGRRFAVGDRVVARRGRTLSGIAGPVRVRNGHRGTITGVDATARAVEVTLDRGQRTVTVPAGYLDAGHLDHGYAISGHRAQGMTAERCWILGSDALYQQWGYVALSRGRRRNQLYITAGDLDVLDDVDRHGIEPDRRDPTVRLAAWLARSKTQQLALDLTRDDDQTPSLTD